MGEKTFTIPKALVISGMNSYLSGMEICIDNWGPWNGRDWHINNSYVLTPSGRRIEFELPKSPTVVTGARRWGAYISDTRSNQILVKADENRLKVDFFFESAGEEIKIGCINRASDKPCVIHALKHSGQLDHSQVSVSFQPIITTDRVSLSQPSVEVNFDFSFDSWVLESLRDLIDRFVDTNEILKRQLKIALQDALRDDETLAGLTINLNEAVLDRAAESLRPILGAKTSEFVKENVRIIGLEDSGGFYRVKVFYPDPITSHALRITSFTVDKKDDTIDCPGDVNFSATVHTDYAMKGEAWLENEDGSTTRTFDWVTRKEETATSPIVRRWQFDDFEPHLGWSRIAISFEDVFGIKHIKRSRKAEFERTCRKRPGGITF